MPDDRFSRATRRILNLITDIDAGAFRRPDATADVRAYAALMARHMERWKAEDAALGPDADGPDWSPSVEARREVIGAIVREMFPETEG